MSYAIRSGIAITSTYALKQCGRLMKVSPCFTDHMLLSHGYKAV
jgi:hypothetical protein